MTGGGGGPSDFFGSEILAKSDFLGVYEGRRDFFGMAKKKPRGIFLGCKKGLRDFFASILKIVVILLGRKILDPVV